jgi:hypothetical protein
MKDFKIIHIEMGELNEVRDVDTLEVIFSTILPKDISEDIGRRYIQEDVVDNVVNIWNETGKAEANLWSDGKLDEYLLNEGKCTQEEREVIVESLFYHANKK